MFADRQIDALRENGMRGATAARFARSRGRGAALARGLIFAVAVLAACVGLWRLLTSTDGLSVTRSSVAGTPVTIFEMVPMKPAPVVVIAHGFAGSQQLMQPFAITLARSGYLVVTYDLLGHGRNPMPLTGDVTKVEGATANLVRQLGMVADFARALPGSDGRLAVLGHSMATDVIMRYAVAHPDVSATVAISMFSPAVTATSPKDLLIVVGDWESGLKREALRAADLAAGGNAQEGETYGSIAGGSARRVIFADHVEHVGVLYSSESLAAARDWLNLVFTRTISAPVEARGLSLGLFFVGMLIIARFATGLLPRIMRQPVGADARWAQLAVTGVVPAMLTPLILWKAPVDVLPVPVGGYLAAHFLLFGLLTAGGLFWFRGVGAKADALDWRGIAGAIVAVTLFCLAGIYLPIDAFITSFVPTSGRWLLVVTMAIGLLPYFIADEWLTRGTNARKGAYFFTKICFLLSLAAAIALNLEGLFFLIIIVPVILVFFTMFGLISSWVYRRTGHPAVAAMANALLFAWAIAVTFPILGR